MPKATFENLPAEKREAFVAIALDEFAHNDYAAASVSRIVERAGIAKGSVYQYFLNKQDLYLYLLEYAGGVLLEEVSRQTRDARPAGFFATLRLQMSATLRAAVAYPVHASLVKRSSLAPAAVRAALDGRMTALQQGHFLDMVRQAIAAGELSADLDPLFAAWFIGAVVNDMAPLVMAALGLDRASAVAADDAVWQSPQIEAIYDRVVRMLEHGLGAPRLR